MPSISVDEMGAWLDTRKSLYHLAKWSLGDHESVNGQDHHSQDQYNWHARGHENGHHDLNRLPFLSDHENASDLHFLLHGHESVNESANGFGDHDHCHYVHDRVNWSFLEVNYCSFLWIQRLFQLHPGDRPPDPKAPLLALWQLPRFCGNQYDRIRSCGLLHELPKLRQYPVSVRPPCWIHRPNQLCSVE